MLSFEFKIADEHGIHARPAGMLVKLCGDFKSDITIKNGDKTASPKKLFSLMSLGAKCGDTLFIEVSGEDEELVKSKLLDFLQNNL